MMRLITGVPGAGKTLFAVSEILKEAKEGREIYTNIEGINIPGVQALDGTDWRDYPDGSLIVYDEAHQIFRATGKPGLSADPVINDMDMHRHRGFDLWFITQFPTKVHHEIRSMVDEHFHLLRQFGAKQATLYKWPESVDVKDQGQRSAADKTLFRYPTECFQYYKSASIHTAKVRIPGKLKVLAVVVGMVGLFVGYRLYAHGGLASLHSDDVQVVVEGGARSAEAQPRPGPADTSYDYTPLGGCVASDRGCHCYTPSLDYIALPDHQCRNLLEGPLPRNLKLERSS